MKTKIMIIIIVVSFIELIVLSLIPFSLLSYVTLRVKIKYLKKSVFLRKQKLTFCLTLNEYRIIITYYFFCSVKTGAYNTNKTELAQLLL